MSLRTKGLLLCNTPLMYAAKGNHPHTCQELLSHGADFTFVNLNDDTAHVIAIDNNTHLSSCFVFSVWIFLDIMVRYRSCSVMRCEDKFSSRHRFSDAANNLNLFSKVGVNEANKYSYKNKSLDKPSSTLTTGNVGVNI
ncbi:hypothetical protein NQ317_016513 [Molorchus minor]|uniref:Uncharacterized protein n=1 Tax=Molorchus minor TaxID=1323400 RepID=A0ABQ9JC51_9CUCU|nr:hypothetical protein NQ317_016513 [Molorchus minor]